jgi:unsaturated rhamnogalacturonyl hydrolase
VNYRLFGLPHAIRIGTGLRDFWKINEAEGRLWSDGAFMTVPFLVEYGILFGDQASIDEAAKQLLVYARHLQGPSTGLLYHAYDETGRAPWLEPGTRHSGEFWCRAVGWYGMALVHALEHLRTHAHMPSC